MKSILLYLLVVLLMYGCTKPPLPPVGQKIEIVTNDATAISSSTASCSGNVTADQFSNITDKGICWDEMSAPSIDDNVLSSGPDVGGISHTITGLLPNKRYYVRAYIKNYAGTIYGNEISFQTLGNPPAITTNAITSITQTTAVSGGSQINAGGLSITAKGVCWSTSPGPTTSNNKTTNGTGTGNFSSNMTGLTANTNYYVRSYATNSVGTSYGQELQFTTASSLAIITTSAVSSITANTANSGGVISSDGGASVTQRGVCWSNVTTNPTIANSRTVNGTGTGSFTSNITGLNSNTTYYLRAYATNANGTAYGQVQQFTTLSGVATITTSSVNSITATTAMSGGVISSDGGSSITQRGVCWSNSTTNPTIANSRTLNGTGTGSFTSNVTGLSPSTTYYLRAYATNTVGTSYGSTVSFTTTSLAAPILSSPTNGSNRPCCSINFSWTNVTGAIGYEIQISRSSSFSGTVFTVNVCGGSSYPSTTGYSRALPASNSFCMNGGTSTHVGTWYWRVRATNGSNTGTWSSTFNYNYTN